MLARDNPTSFSFDQFLAFSCQLAQQSLTFLATSDRFLLGDDLGDGEFEILVFLDGVLGVLGDLTLLGEAAAMLKLNVEESWVLLVARKRRLVS